MGAKRLKAKLKIAEIFTLGFKRQCAHPGKMVTLWPSDFKKDV